MQIFKSLRRFLQTSALLVRQCQIQRDARIVGKEFVGSLVLGYGFIEAAKMYRETPRFTCATTSSGRRAVSLR